MPADVDGYLVTRDRRIRYSYGTARAGDVIPGGAARIMGNLADLVADGTLQHFPTYAEARQAAATVAAQNETAVLGGAEP